jgi:hypothetical protein
MRSAYITHIAVPSYDEGIGKAMKEAARDGGGNVMRIAVENDAGTVYRVIETVGLPEFIDLVAGLEDLGGHDRLYDKNGVSPEGYDCRFHF